MDEEFNIHAALVEWLRGFKRDGVVFFHPSSREERTKRIHPSPGPGEVRIKVLAAGTGFTDTFKGVEPDIVDGEFSDPLAGLIEKSAADPRAPFAPENPCFARHEKDPSRRLRSIARSSSGQAADRPGD